jgi:hypothetical protein
MAEFDAQTWHALNLLSRESMKSFQELADEAFWDLLHKHGRPTDLKSALRESAKAMVSCHDRANTEKQQNGNKRSHGISPSPVSSSVQDFPGLTLGSGGLLGWWRRRQKNA